MTFYRVVRKILKPLYGFIFRIEIEGAEHVPSGSPSIIAPNHYDNMDALTVAYSLNRDFGFMAKEELFHVPILGAVFKKIGLFPIKRGRGDVGAVRTALHILEKGYLLLMFPEGTRSKTGKLLKPKSGVAYLSIKSEVPVVPVAISGKYRFRGRIHIRFGEPMNFSEYYGQKVNAETLQTLSENVMKEIGTMLEERPCLSS